MTTSNYDRASKNYYYQQVHAFANASETNETSWDMDNYEYWQQSSTGDQVQNNCNIFLMLTIHQNILL